MWSNLLFRQVYADKDDHKINLTIYLQTRFRKKLKLRYWPVAPYKNSRPSGIDSSTYSYQHILWRYTYVKGSFFLKTCKSKLYSMLHTRHKISTSNASKLQVYSYWFCNYKHAMVPQSVGYYTHNWHKQGSQYSLWHFEFQIRNETSGVWRYMTEILSLLYFSQIQNTLYYCIYVVRAYLIEHVSLRPRSWHNDNIKMDSRFS